MSAPALNIVRKILRRAMGPVYESRDTGRDENVNL